MSDKIFLKLFELSVRWLHEIKRRTGPMRSVIDTEVMLHGYRDDKVFYRGSISLGVIHQTVIPIQIVRGHRNVKHWAFKKRLKLIGEPVAHRHSPAERN